MHRLFEAQVLRAPEARAVTFGAAGLTYRALNARANGLAACLRGQGVGRDAAVGVSLPRSLETIVTVLAVWKAGGACVPLDRSYPAERLSYMLADSGARLVISDRPMDGVLVIDPAAGASTGENLPDLPDSGPESLAYIIYTSGSTGRPKGVEMPHRPILNLLAWHARACPLAAGARVLQFAPLSFDVAFQEIGTTLAEGGALALVDDALRRDPRGLLRFLADEGIERIFLPPVMLHQLAEQQIHSPFSPHALREVIVAGEALRITPAMVGFFASIGANCTLSNHYGPSETHVATACTLEGPPESWPALPPIGRPIDGVRAEIGKDGELSLAGACLARGYRNNPGGTSERFVNIGADRAYRTGDLVERLPDGSLQFLGRADDQVKIRGFRVELGEVETVLSRHPAVAATAVAAAPNAAGTQELIGYLVPRAGQPVPGPADLRRWLLERLPDYLAPAHFVVLDKFPLTASGKVDRRALPPIEAPRVTPAPPAAAQTPLERIIARLWEEALGLQNPGPRDNFFEVGGNSILAVQVHTRLCEAMGREFPITDLFEHPTIAALARHLTAAGAASERLDPLRERARRQLEQQRAAAQRHQLARRG